MVKRGYKIFSGGTDNHLMLIDLSTKGVTGKEAEDALNAAGVVVNKNAIPYDTRPPAVTSGMRLGTPCVSTRGMGPAEMAEIAGIIDEVVSNHKSPEQLAQVADRVKALCARFPLYQDA
jgi:glycine hydroxymethyltransferase